MISADTSTSPTTVALIIALAIIAAFGLASGLVLWALHGPLIFTELVDFALAWCQ